jgi:predicted nucleic acid binding AN1-type Zn finger protein
MSKCSHVDCIKRLKLTDMKCKCRNIYCSLHRLPETHKCTFDFKLKKEEINKIQQEMRCINQKVIKI